MRPFRSLLAILIFSSAASLSSAGAPFMPAPIDVGDLTSDGAGGWNYLVRPLAPGETAPSAIQFLAPPFEITEPPATPSQSSVSLLAGQPLLLTIPNSGPFLPMSFEVSHLQDGDEINVEIFRIYGIEADSPFDILGFEYLHPLGPLAPGDYTLNMTFFTADGPSPPTVITGFLSFTVSPIPSPATLGLLLPAVACGAAAMRYRRRAGGTSADSRAA